jgi:hypothetical protein
LQNPADLLFAATKNDRYALRSVQQASNRMFDQRFFADAHERLKIAHPAGKSGRKNQSAKSHCFAFL